MPSIISTYLIVFSTIFILFICTISLTGGCEMNFGETLKKLRKNKNLTQSQLGEKIGVAKSVVSYYENGDRYPSPEILIKIAHTFNVSTDYLLGLNREKSINVSGLNEEDIQVVLSVVEALRRKQP